MKMYVPLFRRSLWLVSMSHRTHLIGSHWFCILKKDGKALHPVHSLEPLNRVTIQHPGVPPIPEHLAEQFGGHACGGMLDLYVGYDERLIAETSRDYTTFQTPFSAL
jgi:hypothetical protein